MTVAARDAPGPSDTPENIDAPAARDDREPGASDTSTPDAAAAEASPVCETIQFDGTINRMSFADALRAAQAAQAGNGMWGMFVVVRGARDTKGLECFDGMITELQLVQCGGPLYITSLPRGTRRVDTAEACPLAEISGLVNVDDVYLADASAITDFSALAGATRVGIGGYPSLAPIAAHVQQAQVLEMSIRAGSLAPLNSAQATQVTLNVRGATSLADYQPSALTCFSIHLEALSTQDEATAIAPLCTALRDGRQCPAYHGCFKDYL
jgi:hypothetical protein